MLVEPRCLPTVGSGVTRQLQVQKGSPVGRVTQAALNPRRERQLVLAAETGDVTARSKLVEVFLPAITAVAHRFPIGAGIERQELVQEGVAGLLFAARRYDPRRSPRFWVYASFWVRKSMQDLVSDLARPIALSDRAARDLARIKTAHREFLQAYGCEPTGEQLSDATGLAPVQVDRLQAAARAPRGMEERLGVEVDTVGDLIPDPLAERAYEHVLDRVDIRAVHERAHLDERERKVIRAHYGFDQQERTLDQIGGALGLTGERARQIEAGALKKLRDTLPA
jgi:RNA polymerase primary sigma factor